MIHHPRTVTVCLSPVSWVRKCPNETSPNKLGDIISNSPSYICFGDVAKKTIVPQVVGTFTNPCVKQLLNAFWITVVYAWEFA